jgi:hypothetical protein
MSLFFWLLLGDTRNLVPITPYERLRSWSLEVFSKENLCPFPFPFPNTTNTTLYTGLVWIWMWLPFKKQEIMRESLRSFVYGLASNWKHCKWTKVINKALKESYFRRESSPSLFLQYARESSPICRCAFSSPQSLGINGFGCLSISDQLFL